MSTICFIRGQNHFHWTVQRQQACVLYLYLGWCPFLSSAEAAPPLWCEAAPSESFLSHSSPFSDRGKKTKKKPITDSEPKSMKVESVYLKQCFKLLLLQSQVGKKNQTLFIILILENKLLSGLEHIKPLSLAALLVYEMFRLISKTHQFVKLHLQVLLLYIDTSVSTEGLVHVLGPLWWMSIWPEKLQWWKKK